MQLGRVPIDSPRQTMADAAEGASGVKAQNFWPLAGKMRST